MNYVYKVSAALIILFLGLLFHFAIFPPRNFESTGSGPRIDRRQYSLDYDRFMSTDDIYKTMENLAPRDGPVKLRNLSARTSNDKPIYALELNIAKAGDVKKLKRGASGGILIVGGLNAMSWTAPVAILTLIDHLLYDIRYKSPFRTDYRWFFVPIVNPDGFDYTQKQLRRMVDCGLTDCLSTAPPGYRFAPHPDRWEKNVDQATENATCFGINIDRNFPYHWQDDVPLEADPDPCSQYYGGTKPFSSPETRAIRDYIEEHDVDIDMAIHLEMTDYKNQDAILFPWRYCLGPPPNFDELQAIGEYAAKHARLPNGRVFQVAQASTKLQAGGTFADYMMGVAGTKLVYFITPYHRPIPKANDIDMIGNYINTSISAIFGLVRGWRSKTKMNTLSISGTDTEF